MILNPCRIRIEKRGKTAYLLDAFSHLAWELNDSSYLICQDLLNGKQPEETADHLHNTFHGLSSDQALEEVQSFISELNRRSFILEEDHIISWVPRLRKVTFGVTDRCNLRCKHCLASSTLDQANDLPLEKIAQLSVELHELGCKSVSLFGGEPLLREDLWDIVHLFKKNGVEVRINTNATLADGTFAKRAREEKISLFTASLDGSAPSVHDPLRGKGSFKKALAGIRTLLEEENRIILSVTVNRLNYSDMADMTRLARELGVLKIRFNEVHFNGNAACFQEEIRLKGKEKLQAIKAILEIEKQDGDFVTGSLLDQARIVNSVSAETPLNFPLVVAPCGAGMGSVCIRPDGNVTPCEILWDSICGNVFHEPLERIYYHNSVMNRFRQPLIITEEDVPGCAGCQYVRPCFIGHRCAPFYFTGGTLNQKKCYTCWMK